MSTKEEWRPIKGYEGYYEVSNLGKVRSLDRVVVCKNKMKLTKPAKTLKQVFDKDGYMRVTLCSKEGKKKHGIHRLVAQAFVKNPDNLPLINHIDANKQNNCMDNLEWCTAKQNSAHAQLNKLVRYKSGQEHHNAKFVWKQIQEIRTKYNSRDKKYSTRTLAKEYNVSPATIRNIVKNLTYKE